MGQLYNQKLPGYEKPKVYSVPRRFSLAAIMIVTAAFAGLFGLMKWFGASPLAIAFVGLFLAGVGIAQMVLGKTPRSASAVAGAVLLPLFTIISMKNPVEFFDHPEILVALPCLILGGLILGYGGGVLVGGVFLFMDFFGQAFGANRSHDVPPDELEEGP